MRQTLTLKVCKEGPLVQVDLGHAVSDLQADSVINLIFEGESVNPMLWKLLDETLGELFGPAERTILDLLALNLLRSAIVR